MEKIQIILMKSIVMLICITIITTSFSTASIINEENIHLKKTNNQAESDHSQSSSELIEKGNLIDEEKNNLHKINHTSYTYNFENPILDSISIDDTKYSQIKISDTNQLSISDAPKLPVKGVKILLPYNEKIQSISINNGEKTIIKLDHKIEPAPDNVPMVEMDQQLTPKPDETIYNSNKLFPTGSVKNMGVQYFRGFPILILSLYPIQYNPLDDEIYFSPHITIEITTEKINNTNPLYRGLNLDFQNLGIKIDNPKIAETYPVRNTQPQDDTKFIIITTNELKDSFSPLKRAHDMYGLHTEIFELEDIVNDSAFWDENPLYNDTQCILRNFITDVFNTSELEYVLLGGDSDIIPARIFTIDGFCGPSDLYYACLDGSYNSDGDDLWGESDDGQDIPDGNDDVDLLAEVFIGRACVGNSMEVGNFVNKTISYMGTNDEYLNQVLMVGQKLANNTWGGDYMDELINESYDHGYYTVGIPEGKAGYNISKLYDKNFDPPYYWPKELLIDYINNGIYLINHLGHAGPYYNMKLLNSDVDELTNTKFCFIYSQGCDSGAFDNPWGADCIAEHFTVKTPYGAFAGIWNAREGNWCTANHFHRQFWDAVFEENNITLGMANQDSKEDNLFQIDSEVIRKHYYQLNLFGDPSLRIRRPWLQDHNIKVDSMEINPLHAHQNTSIFVNATISNNGENDESNIIVSFRVNGNEVNQTIISSVGYHESSLVSFSWNTPQIAGKYKVTINATIEDVIEESYGDNEKNQIIKVGVLNNNTDKLFNTIQEAIDDNDTIDGHFILVPKAIYLENIDIDKNIYLIGEKRDSTVIQGTGSKPNVLSIQNTHSLKISSFTIINEYCGVRINSSSNTNITNCEIINNDIGICINSDSTYNLVYHNNFNNTQTNAFDYGSSNMWNNGYPPGGNYWDDYAGSDEFHGPNQDQFWPDGIGDIPYVIDDCNSEDKYPLKYRYSSTNPILNTDTGERFLTVQEAINDENTNNGHTIFVNPGIYNENIVIDKGITLLGADKNTTIITNNESSNIVIWVVSDLVNISGMTIQSNLDYWSFSGIYIGSNQVIINNNIIQDSQFGINSCSSNHTITDNIFINNSCSITLSGSSGAIITNNQMNTGGFYFQFYNPISWNSLILENNTIKGKIIRYYKNTKNIIVPNNTAQVILYNTSNFTISNFNFSSAGIAVHLTASSNTTISNCTLNKNYYGIYLEESSNNTIFENKISCSKFSGINLYLFCSNNSIRSNRITKNGDCGICIDLFSKSNIIADNQLNNNSQSGLKISQWSDKNAVVENYIFNNSESGILINMASKNKILNNSVIMNKFYDCGDGINLGFSSHNIVSNNKIADNINGISLYYSQENSLRNNNITQNQEGIYIYFFSSYNTISKNNIFDNTNFGVYLYGDSPSNMVSENVITGNLGGIKLEYVNNENISMNEIYNNDNIGIEIGESTENNISNNAIYGNFDGISINTSYYNDIQKNSIMENFHGIYLKGDSSSNRIKENNIIQNYNGVYIPGFISYPSNNYIFNNNFINNTRQALDDCENIWDSGYPHGGNYWNDYSGSDIFGGLNQNENWPDGIGDIPYLTHGASIRQDRYPFMDPEGWKFVLDEYQSFFTLTNENMLGLTTCPAGDGPAYNYAKATILNIQGEPLVGIPASSFRWRVISTDITQYYGDLSCIFNPIDNETNSEGEIRFEIIGNTSIIGQIMIDLHVLGVMIHGVDFLDCKSFDLNVDGSVNITDFAIFAKDYSGTEWQSDFNWDGAVNIADFGMFASHYCHGG